MASKRIARDGRVGASTRSKIRERVWARSDKHCHWCRIALIRAAERPETFVVDHVVPRAGGGEQASRENEVAACYRCNALKSDLPPDLWLTVLEHFKIRERVAAGEAVNITKADVIRFLSGQGEIAGGRVEFVTQRRWWDDETDAKMTKLLAAAGYHRGSNRDKEPLD